VKNFTQISTGPSSLSAASGSGMFSSSARLDGGLPCSLRRRIDCFRQVSHSTRRKISFIFSLLVKKKVNYNK
jgi:hypothetical protein